MIDFFTNLEILFGSAAECYLDFWSMSSPDMIEKAEFLLLIPYKDRGKIHEWANLMKAADESFGEKFIDKFGKPKITPPEETDINVPYVDWDTEPDFSYLVTFQNREQAEWYQKEILDTKFDGAMPSFRMQFSVILHSQKPSCVWAENITAPLISSTKMISST